MRNPVSLLKAAAAAFLATSTAALAQYGSAPQTPPPEQPRVERPDAAPATPTSPADLLRAVACQMARGANPGIAMLGTAPMSTEERTQAAAILRTAQRCARLDGPIAASATTTRGAVAESLYELQFATPAAARTPALGATPLARPAQGDAELLAALAPMYALVDCSVPKAPELVRALLATEPRSAEEGAALQALVPTFNTCVPVGTQLSVDPRFMRIMFAEAIYRWSVVQRDGPTSPWAAPAAAAAPAPATQ